MLATYCKELWIHFVTGQSRNGQHITLDDSRAHALRVTQSGNVLTAEYLDRQGNPFKQVTFNYAHVLEYTCEQVNANLKVENS